MSGSPQLPARRPTVVIVALFSVAIFLNAALLFSVEPMFAKMVLPLLGGVPSVWNTCLLFFQGALLIGYLYAHATSRWLDSGRQAWLHLVLLTGSIVLLPIAVGVRAQPPQGTSGETIFWLLRLLTVTLGLPFVLLAAGAPMVQRWFATTSHPSAGNPYFLYGASNLGSFVALLAYPTLIEPRLRLTEQSGLWRVLYVGLIAVLALIAMATRRWRANDNSRTGTMGRGDGDESYEVVGGAPQPPSDDDMPPSPTIQPNLAWRLRWVLLSFAPSSLLLGVTTFLSTDVASAPFLWVAPLALYLLTFVLVFARRPPFSRTVMLVVQLFLVLGLLVVMGANPTKRITTVALLHLLTFFVTAMVCHRELAEARPRASDLTEFYLWMSLGGVLGGVFNVLLAPVLYDRILEYPFALIIALGLRPSPGAASGPRDRPMLLDLLLPIALFGMVAGGFRLLFPLEQWGDHALYLYLGAAALAAAACYKRPLRLALAAGAVLLAADAGIGRDDNTILRARSFFGVYSVRRWNDYAILQHGTTTHGAQSIRIDRRTDPLTYYHRQGPLGDIFRLATDPRAPRSVAVVGLGTGTTACYSRPGEQWTYFEIDSVVVRIARSPALFTYLRDCQPNAQVVLGDARRSLANTGDASFDLIVLDAFSSDAIPVHLITQEALRLYERKLRPGGLVAFHISNRYLELRPVLVELARDAHMAGATADRDVTAAQKAQLYYGSRWVVLASSARSLEPLIRDAHWEALASSAPVHLWTDDYSDVLGVMRWKQ